MIQFFWENIKGFEYLPNSFKSSVKYWGNISLINDLAFKSFENGG